MEEFRIVLADACKIVKESNRKRVISGADEDGRVMVEFSEPVGGRRVKMLTPDEINGMLYKEETSESPANAEEVMAEETEPPTAGQEESGESALERIPKDAQTGEPQYTQTDADTAWDAIVEQTEGDKDMARYVAESTMKAKEEALKKLESSEPKAGATVTETIAAAKEHKAAIAAARQELEQWKAIAEVENRRKAEEKVVSSVPAVGNDISNDTVEVQSQPEVGNSMSGNSSEATSSTDKISESSKTKQGKDVETGVKLSDEIDENGRQFVLTSNGDLAFGEIGKNTGLTEAPILLSEGVITNTSTNDGYGLAHIEARHGEQIRKAGYKSVIDFIEKVAKNYDVIKKGSLRDGRQTYRLQLTDKHNNTLMVELSDDGAYWNINTAGIFKTSYGKKNEEVYNRHTTVKQSVETVETSQDTEQSDTQVSPSMNVPTTSTGKVSESSETKQEKNEKSEEPKSEEGNGVDDAKIDAVLEALDKGKEKAARRLASKLTNKELSKARSKAKPSFLLEYEWQWRAQNRGDVSLHDWMLENQYAEPVKRVSGTFKMTDYIAPKDSPYAERLGGVFHDNSGFAVASDGRILVADKGSYDPKLKGKIIGKDGAAMENKFPDWQEAISTAKETKSSLIDVEDLHRFVAGVLRANKRAYISLRFPDGTVGVFKANRLNLMLRAMKQLGTSELLYTKDGMILVAKSEKGTAMLMGLVSAEDELVEANGYAYPGNTVSMGKVSESPETKQEKNEKSAEDSQNKITDVGEKISGARKDLLRDFSNKLKETTLESLITLPFSKAFKRPDLKTAVEQGLLRQRDARFAEAVMATYLSKNKPRLLSGWKKGESQKNLEAWAKDAYFGAQTLRALFEVDETTRDKLIDEILSAKAYREDDIDRRKKQLEEWNPGEKFEGKCYPLNPTAVYMAVYERLGYDNIGEFKLPVSGVGSSTFFDHYELTDDSGKKIYPTRALQSFEDVVDEITYLSKVKNADEDTDHPNSIFRLAGINPVWESTGWQVLTLGTSSSKRPEKHLFKTKEEAEKFAEEYKAGGKYRQASTPIENKEFIGYGNYELKFHLGEKDISTGLTFSSKKDALAAIDTEHEKLNAIVNEKLAKARESGGKNEKRPQKDYVRIQAYTEDGNAWKYAVVLDERYAPKSTAFNTLPYSLANGFSTRKEAVAYIEKHRVEWDAKIDDINRRRKDFVFLNGSSERVGEDYRKGEDITAEQFREQFGFRGVQFGNWTNQKDRQAALNNAFDSFMDLAKILGISPRAVSLNGELDIAFGARGGGGAKAHYEREEVVINLTKTMGAGSLAHEWWHALDNYFARRGNVKLGMVTEGKGIAMRGELRKAYDKLASDTENSDYHRRSRDAGASYWGTRREETARMFAMWVFDEISKKGERNSFLTDNDPAAEERYAKGNYDFYVLMCGQDRAPMAFEEFRKSPSALAGYVYPSQQELEEFGADLRKIFDTVQERVDEETGNTVLYHRGEVVREMSQEERVLRDAVIDRLRESGMEVITDEEAGQRVLDEANGREVRLSAKQKRALETVTIADESTNNATAISSADGAKIQKNLETLAENYNNRSNRVKGFITDLSQTLNLEQHEASHYGTFETKDGKLVTIRVSNHNARVSLFDENGEDDGISIVISSHKNKGLLNDGDAHIVEYFYPKQSLERADSKPLSDIIKSVSDALNSGKFEDTTGLAQRQEVNGKTIREHRVWHGSEADFETFDHSHMGEGEGSQAFGWGTYVTNSKDIGFYYATRMDNDPSKRSNLFQHSNGTRFKKKYPTLESFLQDTKRMAINGKVTEQEKIDYYHKMMKLAEPYHNLYAVEIPEDNGKNYLDWDSRVGARVLSKVNRQLEKQGKRSINPELSKRYKFLDGNDLYRALSIRMPNDDATFNDDKAASEFLYSLGFVGIKYKAGRNFGDAKEGATNYVIFNEKDAKITDHVRFFRTADGEAYGFTVCGKIYIDPKIANTETPIHEYAHLWAAALRGQNPKEWQNIVELMKGTSVWDEVKKRYPELNTDNDIADEVLATYSGRRGAERLREEQRKIAGDKSGVFEKAEAISALERVKQALRKFWKSVADFLHIHYKSAEEVADRVMKDLLDGVDPGKHFNSRNDAPRFMFADTGKNMSLESPKEDDINAKFNIRLAELVKNPDQKDKVLHLGRSSKFLTDGGLADAEIILEFDKLAHKSKEGYKHEHPFDISDIKDLPKAISSPIAVFDNTNGKNDGRVILTELKKDGRNFIVAVKTSAQNRRGGIVLEVNQITTLFPKDAKGIVYWFNSGKATNIDKEKALRFIEALPNHPGTTIKEEELFSAAKVVKDFVNPKFESENDALFRGGKELRDGRKIEFVKKPTATYNALARHLQAEGIKPDMHEARTGSRYMSFEKDGVQWEVRSSDHTKPEYYGEAQKPVELTYYKDKQGEENLSVSVDLGTSGYNIESMKALMAEIDRLKNDAGEVKESFDRGVASNEVVERYPLLSQALGVKSENEVRAKEEARKHAEEARKQEMRSAVEDMAGKLHLNNVDIVDKPAGRGAGRRERAKGMFERSTGRITINTGNCADKRDAVVTLLHEAVAHHGLRKLFGENFETFLDNVYNSANAEIRRIIDKHSSRYGGDKRTATEEYMASLAERTDFENAKKSGWWQRIKDFFLKMLEKIGLKGFKGEDLSDNELRYVLWRSYENLKSGGKDTVFSAADDLAKQSEFKVGEFAPDAKSEGSVAALNTRFNNELQQQIDGNLPSNHIYQMGNPGQILRSTGLPDLPIQMNAKRLQDKATLFDHNFELYEVKDLVKALQNPLAVFSYGDKTKAQNIIVPLQKDGKNFIVGLSLNPTVGGKALEINSIRNVFPKDNSEWLNWISQGKALYLDKEKIQTLIAQQRTNLADVEYLDLDSAAKVVENFENPKPESKNDILFRDGDAKDYEKAQARETYERRVSTGMFQSREAIQDSMLSLKVAMDAIEEAAAGKAKRIEDYDGFENAYLGENRLSSVNQAESAAFAHLLIRPMMEEVNRLAPTAEDRAEFIDYMFAKHGLERNAYMRQQAAEKKLAEYKKQNPGTAKTAADFIDAERDYAGLTTLTGEADVSAAEAGAQRMEAEYKKTTHFMELGMRYMYVERKSVR